MGEQGLRLYCIELHQVDYKVKISVLKLRCVIHTLITSNHRVQGLTKGLIANNAVGLTNAGAYAALHPAYTFFTQRKYTKKRQGQPFRLGFPCTLS